MDITDKLNLTDHNNRKQLLKLLAIRACEKTTSFGMKIVVDVSKWDRMQAFEVFEMTRAYYQHFANSCFRNFMEKTPSESAKEVFLKLHLLNMKC